MLYSAVCICLQQLPSTGHSADGVPWKKTLQRNQLLPPGQQAIGAGHRHVRSGHVHADIACLTSLAKRPLNGPQSCVTAVPT